MTKRTELTLGSLLIFTAFGVGIVSYGQLSGQFPLISQSLLSSADVTTPTSIILTDDPNIVTETFITTTLLDQTATTADWNMDARELILKPTQTEGLGQSLKFADRTGDTVTVTLRATVDQPIGSEVYYALSGDGGKIWTPVLPGRSVTLIGQGDWRWRVVLKRGYASYSPSVQKVRIQFAPTA